MRVPNYIRMLAKCLDMSCSETLEHLAKFRSHLEKRGIRVAHKRRGEWVFNKLGGRTTSGQVKSITHRIYSHERMVEIMDEPSKLIAEMDRRLNELSPF